MHDILTGLALILASLIALVWFASVTFVAWLGWQAAVGNPAVVMDEPCPLAVGDEFRAELASEAIDLALWDAEVTR